MSRTSATDTVREDFKVLAEDLLNVVTPKLESAMHTVADRTPAAIEATRVAATGARETSAHLRDAMVERIPDGMVDRLPDALADHLGAKKPRRGRKLVLLAAALAVGGVGFAALRQKRNARHSTYTPAPPAPSAPPRAVADDPGAVVPPGEGTGTPDA